MGGEIPPEAAGGDEAGAGEGAEAEALPEEGGGVGSDLGEDAGGEAEGGGVAGEVGLAGALPAAVRRAKAPQDTEVESPS